MAEWQPIETAPRNKVILGFWKPDPGRAVLPESYGMAICAGGEWESVEGESWAPPDYWMPLPDPPVSTCDEYDDDLKRALGVLPKRHDPPLPVPPKVSDVKV